MLVAEISTCMYLHPAPLVLLSSRLSTSRCFLFHDAAAPIATTTSRSARDTGDVPLHPGVTDRQPSRLGAVSSVRPARGADGISTPRRRLLRPDGVISAQTASSPSRRRPLLPDGVFSAQTASSPPRREQRAAPTVTLCVRDLPQGERAARNADAGPAGDGAARRPVPAWLALRHRHDAPARRTAP